MNNTKDIVDSFVSEMFRGTNKCLLEDTVPITIAKQDLSNEFERYFNDEKNAERTRNLAKNYGINLDRGEERRAYRNKALGANPDTETIQKGSYEKAVGNISNELRDALRDWNIRNNPNTPKEIKDKLDAKWGGFAGFQRYKDIADKLSLTPAYDQKNAKEAGTNVAPFGTNYKTINPNGETSLSANKPTGEVSGFDFENLDLTSVPDSEIIKYFKTGTRASHAYDEETGESTNPNKGIPYGTLADMAKKGDERAMSDLKNLYFKAMFNKILNSKFGYDFKIPTSMYTMGNAKLPDDTLVINFTSAHRCPAWNECLVGYACYARGSEHNYEGLHQKNTNLHLMWSSAEHDKKLLDAMFNVIKMHLINPGNIASALLNNPNTSQKWIKLLNSTDEKFVPLNKKGFNAMERNPQNVLSMPGKNDSQDEEFMETEGVTLLGRVFNEATSKNPKAKALKKPVGASNSLARLIYTRKFQDLFDERDIEVIKSNPKTIRAKFIRLNEEGDFIGQWLLNAFDEFAGELKLLGISTAAYTCRNLNFDSIKNIIINASTTKVGTLHGDKNPDNGKTVSNAIARRFFAVSSELYDSLEDTYIPTGRQLKYRIPEKTKNGEYDGSKALVPLHKIGGDYHVKYDLKAYTNNEETTNPETFEDLYDSNGPTIKQRLYYKCPCGRHGDVKKNGKPIKMDCYLCRMCYEPKNTETGEIYVLVEVHGDNIDSFDMNKANAARGISNKMTTYKEAKSIFANRLCEEHKEAEEMGMQLVSENIINSVKDRLQEIGNSSLANEMPVESKNFAKMMKLIEEADKKRYNDIID